jgi:hypothetical protein
MRERTGAGVKNLNEVAAYWPTPHQGCTTGAGTQGRAGGLKIQTAVGTWPTPSAAIVNDGETLASWGARKARNLAKHCNGNGMGTPLTIASLQWASARPTPSARDWKSGEAGEEVYHGNARPLNEVACRFSRPDPPTSTPGGPSSPPAPTSRPRLNPLFVGWLMGLPENWLDALSSCGPAAMASYHSRLRMHFTSLRDRWDSTFSL